MSADNYLVLRRDGARYVILEGCASCDESSEYERARYRTIDEALSGAQSFLETEIIEYGLSLEL